MVYSELYAELGRLFYSIAATDGKVHPSEKKTLQELIQKKWKPLEVSTDRFGTDQANVIDFAFDFEESEGIPYQGLQSFEEYYRANKSAFSPLIISNILETASAISSAYRGKNEKEQELLQKLKKLLQK